MTNKNQNAGSAKTFKSAKSDKNNQSMMSV